MKRYFRILTVFLCLFVLIGAFAACNTAPEPSETSGDAGTSEEVTTEEVTTEKIPTETVSSRLTPPEGYTVLEKTTTDSPYSVLQDWEVCDCIHAAEYEDECDFSTVERIEETIPLTETEMEQVEEALRARLYEAYAHRLDIIVVAYHLGNPQLVRVDGTRDALCYEVVTWNAPIDESTMAIWLSEEEFTFYIFLDGIKT